MSIPDDDLRRALHDAVSDVQPHGTYDDIRSRTDKVVPMKRWFLPTIAVAAVMAVVVGGAFWLVGDDDPAAGPSRTPTAPASSPSGTPSDGEPRVEMRAVPVYYLGETPRGPRLFREFRRMEVETDLTAGVAIAATHAVLEQQPIDPDYTNPWRGRAFFSDGEFGEDGITVDLTGDVRDRPAGMSRQEAELAVQQLVLTAQAGLGKGDVPVQLLLHNQHTDTVLGVPAAEPLAAGNPDDVLAPVQVDDPTDGTEVSGTFTVTGRAAAFEANVQWELKQGDTVVKHGFTTAQECCRLAPYSFEVTAPPGDYTLVVHDEDVTGEGRPVNQDTKEITVK